MKQQFRKKLGRIGTDTKLVERKCEKVEIV